MAERIAASAIQHTRSRISYNAITRFGGRTLGGLLSLFALHLAARYFRPDGWGPIAGALAFVFIFTSLADFGVASILSRDLVRANDKASLLGSGLKAALMMSLMTSFIAAGVGIVVFASLPQTRDMILILLPSIPASGVFSVLSATLVARSRNDVRAVFDVVSSLLPLAGVYTIATLHFGRDSYGLLVSAVSVVMVLLGLMVVCRHQPVRLTSPNFEVRSVLREAWPLGVSQIAGAIYLQIDVLLVVAFLSGGEVGQYGLASRIASFFASIPAMVTVAAIPAFMRKSELARRELARRLLRTLAAGAIGTALIGILFSRFVVEIVGGHQYGPAAGALRLLLIAAGISFLASTFWTVIYLTGNQRYLFRIGVVVLIVNVVANLVAIPLWGIDGAAGSLVTSELVALAYTSTVARKFGYFGRTSEQL